MKTMGFMAVLVLPLVLAGIGGIIYIYREVMRLMSKSAVRNKVVVITDAISGLGKECSRVFHNGGARLILCGKTWEKLEALHDALISVADPSMTFSPKLILMDLEDTRAVADVVKEILDCYSCVDVLINNASVKVKGPVQTVSLEMDRKIMDSNYFGPITLTKALLPSMMSRRTGQIVLVNNIQGRIGIPFRAASTSRGTSSTGPIMGSSSGQGLRSPSGSKEETPSLHNDTSRVSTSPGIHCHWHSSVPGWNRCSLQACCTRFL
ncbi:dehydrogenase/reductase (SDR family) member 7Cb isoform X3 [Latimeria chalumnae]|uniref:dehydrogenase/reductase (SDR family) member 7Cb isoform X3 n=1 Tax=Latimeria chalumnae TaxID=7897 RepID=UPI00313D4226